MEVFRRMFLERLHRAERLSESFMRNLLSWEHPGFSVFAGPAVDAAAITSLKAQGRYIPRPALAMDALEKLNDGRLSLETPPDPRTGAQAAKSADHRDNAELTREARSTWARLVREIFETDPLVCSYGARMRIFSFITGPRIIDRILRHRRSDRCRTKDPFEPRAPPLSGTQTVQ
jgi:hypothetical protein